MGVKEENVRRSQFYDFVVNEMFINAKDSPIFIQILEVNLNTKYEANRIQTTRNPYKFNFELKTQSN
ncbi:unnamed protein product [Brachionus calyciflorus]|uniref:Uncharacterized protein n=1 Tax=Brachionus calyciflorus TaxID=104777 RepID=A0A813MFU0_9BILA|nr:unnamed protein product [Brachionus calyciflorus]